MKKLRLVPALLLGVALGACDDSILDVLPVDEISDEIAIVDSKSANAALMGAYSALQSGNLYGGDYILWTETLTDNVEHTGTFEGYADGDLLFMRPEMGVIDGIWTDLYDGINRVNLLIQKVPDITDIDPARANEILGQAYALRALPALGLFDQVNLFDARTEAVKPQAEIVQGGMTLDELGAILASHGLKVDVVHASDSNLEDFRQAVVDDLADREGFVLVNYLRRAIGQESGGHISPLAAYDADTDRFLILDVSRYKYPPVWVEAEDLFAAMDTPDSDNGNRSRGYVIVRR